MSGQLNVFDCYLVTGSIAAMKVDHDGFLHPEPNFGLSNPHPELKRDLYEPKNGE